MIINDVPKLLDINSSQDIRLNGRDTVIDLEMNGPIPYIPVSKQNVEDIEYLPKIRMALDDVEWDPQYIFNEGKYTSHPYLENDHDISYNIQ